MPGPNEFIAQLSGDLKPVRRLLSPSQRLGIWALFSVVSVLSIMFSVQGFRPGFLEELAKPKFLLETLFAFAPFLSTSLILLLIAVPGVRVSPLKIFAAFVPALIFLGFLGFGIYGAPSTQPTIAGARASCFHEILYLSWIPIFALVFLIRRALPPRRVFLGGLIGFAGACLPMAIMQVACMYDPMHVLTHHAYPVLIITGIMALMGNAMIHFKRS
ncbi:MAG: NrsF family protein [Pseudomonadota bacterium]